MIGILFPRDRENVQRHWFIGRLHHISFADKLLEVLLNYANYHPIFTYMQHMILSNGEENVSIASCSLVMPSGTAIEVAETPE